MCHIVADHGSLSQAEITNQCLIAISLQGLLRVKHRYGRKIQLRSTALLPSERRPLLSRRLRNIICIVESGSYRVPVHIFGCQRKSSGFIFFVIADVGQMAEGIDLHIRSFGLIPIHGIGHIGGYRFTVTVFFLEIRTGLGCLLISCIRDRFDRCIHILRICKCRCHCSQTADAGAACLLQLCFIRAGVQSSHGLGRHHGIQYQRIFVIAVSYRETPVSFILFCTVLQRQDSQFTRSTALTGPSLCRHIIGGHGKTEQR